MIRFDRSICGNLEAALAREWLETNGLGAYASSTIVGLNTRRYHGLLIAAINAPVGRMLLLSKLEETLVIDGRRFELSANCYPGVVHPEGYRYLNAFRLDPFPIFTYQVEGRELEKRLFLIHGENTIVVEYDLRGESAGCTLEVRPLVAFRDYHAITHANKALNPSVTIAEGNASIAPYPGLPALHFAHNARALEARGGWYYNFEFDRERERGLDYHEDLFNPFVMEFDLADGAHAGIIASTELRDIAQASALRLAEVERRAALAGASPGGNPLVKSLAAAADQFIVQRAGRPTIIAGYHWFSEWSRDVMIALPGLTLATGHSETARNILAAYARLADRGMLPNHFPDGADAPEYNTVDATLWFFEAIRAYVEATGDRGLLKDQLYATLEDIIRWHLRGTRYGILVDGDGLLASGEPGVQLTWMDAKVGDWVVTPRHGKPVEIQALWYNALRIMEQFSRGFDDGAATKKYADLAEKASGSFTRLFWNEAAGCLYDVVNGSERDASIRPNQIFAVSLPYTMLSEEQARRVVEVVERDLLTPYGLRTLAPADPQYHSRYEGDQRSRDAAYHQGTVWPWLMAPFLRAYLKVNGHSSPAREQAARWLGAFQEHLSMAGLGQVSEIFDADPPHQPRGAIAQAWSVAELLRAAVEDVFG